MFEEDARENMRVCLAMLSEHCTQCGDFHLSVAVRRTTEMPAGADYDGSTFVEVVAEALRRRLAAGGAMSVLIAGAADTKILKMLLDAAVAIGGEELARELSVTVLDLCETPLEMCRVFARRHRLNISTVRSDIGSLTPEGHYGLVLMHGVLPFFPVDQRLSYMRRIVGWLDSDGYVVSSTQIGERSVVAEEREQTDGRMAALDTFLANNAEGLTVDRDDLSNRLGQALVTRRSHPQLFADLADMDAFYAAAGLALAERRVIEVASAKRAARYSQRTVVMGQRA
ncbi:MAG: class I SAM-dependent methyltransferase [Hyphomicrobiales bacterium]|nr:MAG: class I SAM-dependent methyltransferase [Hyphomicrobiales bacterium]